MKNYDKLNKQVLSLAEKKGLNKNLVDTKILEKIPEKAISQGITTPYHLYVTWQNLKRKFPRIEQVNENLSAVLGIKERKLSGVLEKLIEVVGDDFIKAYGKLQKLPAPEYSLGYNLES